MSDYDIDPQELEDEAAYVRSRSQNFAARPDVDVNHAFRTGGMIGAGMGGGMGLVAGGVMGAGLGRGHGLRGAALGLAGGALAGGLGLGALSSASARNENSAIARERSLVNGDPDTYDRTIRNRARGDIRSRLHDLAMQKAYAGATQVNVNNAPVDLDEGYDY